MATMETAYLNSVREQLLAGRARLAEVLAGGEKEHVDRLLNQVDEALQRIELGTFGICEECHTEIGADWLREDPLTTVCLEHMTRKQQRALEYDLELAAQIQKGLLPPCDIAFAGWDICYHYRPAGVVSGDYCDLIPGAGGELYFVMADVSGKGVAAAMLGSNLRAVFRSLIPLGLDTAELVMRANRLFRQSALPTQYATLVCGKVTTEGDVETVNAGHLPGLLARGQEIRLLESTSHPLGMFDGQEFCAVKLQLRPGDTLVLYTDGISEAENDRGDEYGFERVKALLQQHVLECPVKLVDAIKQRLEAFRGRRERFDDETLLAMQYAGREHATSRVAASA
ncbi:MAG TPA: SpoIIE family protein phosphatase [Terriglobales bacterium]|nr:SpoIIE family protein phosphatase [Terriglobales bacterium]